jgi:D-ribitol-5-phosphate cytidylyltransferase
MSTINNIAVIFAGGSGTRMTSSDLPKQFLKCDGKPIIIHTIEKFQLHPEIDAIAVAIKPEFIDYTQELIKKYNITKVKWLVKGGETGQLSIFNALDAIMKSSLINKNTIVLIHDGVRPIIDNLLISDNIENARKLGNAITVASATETVFVSKDKIKISTLLDRDNIYYARAPQTFFLNDIYKTHIKEMNQNHINNIDSCTMMFNNGYTLNFVYGKNTNIKITTEEDFLIFKAIYNHKKS